MKIIAKRKLNVDIFEVSYLPHADFGHGSQIEHYKTVYHRLGNIDVSGMTDEEMAQVEELFVVEFQPSGIAALSNTNPVTNGWYQMELRRDGGFFTILINDEIEFAKEVDFSGTETVLVEVPF